MVQPGAYDEFVGGVAPDASASDKTLRFIEEYKSNPNYRFEAEEAERVLSGLGINAHDYGMPDAKSLLEHWLACISDLGTARSDGTNGPAAGEEDGPRAGPSGVVGGRRPLSGSVDGSDS
jgi:hypothetical protein